MTNQINYRVASPNDIDAIAQLHMECFPDSMWAFLGKELIASFYGEYIKEHNLFVVALDGEEIIGICMGYKRPVFARSCFMKTYRKALMKRVAVGLITFNKLVWKKTIKFLQTKKSEYTIMVEGDLLSICVNERFRGMGVAEQLLTSFEQLLIEQNISAYTLGVYANNSRAISFYKKEGFISVIGNEEEITMLKIIK